MVLYFDLGSPYAYLAVERAGRVLGAEPELQPVLAGAIFAHRGYGSWALTDQRAAGEVEIERRAREYGLPPIAWPPGARRSSPSRRAASASSRSPPTTRRSPVARISATWTSSPASASTSTG